MIGQSSQPKDLASLRSQGASSNSSSDKEFEERAVESFFKDFVEVSSDRAISRGFLDGLELLVQYAGPHSDIARAVRITAISRVAIQMGRLDILKKSRLAYGELLLSFQSAIADPLRGNSMQSLMTAALLGIYEVGYH